jgi:peptide deformylase
MPLLTPEHPNWNMLFTPAYPVTDYATQVRPYIREMTSLIERTKNGGYAIAAPQIGVPFHFFIFGGRHMKRFITICVNPVIVIPPGAIVAKHQAEGCMSFPGKRRDVERAATVHLSYSPPNDLEARIGLVTENYLLACILQHECDHLRGQPLWLADGSENPEFNIKSEEPVASPTA